ncbi:uncharacterized protein MONBRDRAFT_32697 [Monosiga brevicollis MX1]|uniref:Uncharacterized protein n=1 Tax=Monosiga brevicollis TaxID=81824 RepID=A9V159_MONBE|nr:uncharacterized protein MONBRDRAFT_32697 [Monosiga brevicollis MX1]EDQ88751.1 predicted protein [Monosiga brevicollis MX1]|eukprot:XP_001746364.1 hypothetical protein [Monosiga brevicollis MX1]
MSDEIPLRYSWTFWYSNKKQRNRDNFDASMQKMCTVSTVKEFWNVYSFLQRPSELPICDLMLFRDGIRPVWEDDKNKSGGRWSLHLKKGIQASSRAWENLLLAIIGDQFTHSEEVCGVVLKIRQSDDSLCLWNRTASDAETRTTIGKDLRKVLRLDSGVLIKYKFHEQTEQPEDEITLLLFQPERGGPQPEAKPVAIDNERRTTCHTSNQTQFS